MPDIWHPITRDDRGRYCLAGKPLEWQEEILLRLWDGGVPLRVTWEQPQGVVAIRVKTRAGSPWKATFYVDIGVLARRP